MKKIKRLLVNMIAVVIVCCAMMSLAGCKDVRAMELKVSVYDYTQNQTKTVTIDVDLYAHLAPKTVDAIESYVKDGYYDNTIFYKFADASYNSQIMLGNLKDNNEAIEENAIKPELPGEFSNAGVVGSNLVSKKGSIGLWRNWNAYDNTYKTNASVNSGRATWFLPTETNAITDYTGWFCVFAQIDLEDGDNAEAIRLIIDAYASGYVEQYVIYYTGEYNAEDSANNYGLKFNCVKKADFNEEEIENLFEAEGAQYTGYNHYTVNIANKPDTSEFAVKIISAKIK